jgi:hypothetical protein
VVFEQLQGLPPSIAVAQLQLERSKRRQPPARVGHAGVDVMITIFCDFRQFSAGKNGVFLKNQCYAKLYS